MSKMIHNNPFFKYFNPLITCVFVLVIFYIVLFPYYLQFYFENTLGRFAIISFIIAVTFVNPIIGAFATILFISLYHWRTIEGFTTNNATKNEKQSKNDSMYADVPKEHKTGDSKKNKKRPNRKELVANERNIQK